MSASGKPHPITVCFPADSLVENRIGRRPMTPTLGIRVSYTAWGDPVRTLKSPYALRCCTTGSTVPLPTSARPGASLVELLRQLADATLLLR